MDRSVLLVDGRPKARPKNNDISFIRVGREAAKAAKVEATTTKHSACLLSIPCDIVPTLVK